MPRRLALLLFLCLPAMVAYVHEVSANTGDGATCARGQESCYGAGYAGLTPLERAGRDTWYFWTGGDTDAQGNIVGDQALWRILAVRSHGAVDLLQAAATS